MNEAFTRHTVIAGAVFAVVTAAALLWVGPPAAGAPRSVQAVPRSDPAAFLTRIVGLVVENDYAHAWNTLHPAHKRVAPRREYVDCELQTPLS